MPKRIIVCGGPSAGKSTLALHLSKRHGIKNVRNTDQVLALGWSKASDEISTWYDDPADSIVEGCASVRGLRKWLRNNPGKPFEGELEIVVLTKAQEKRTPRQEGMSKQMFTHLSEIYADVIARGATFTQYKFDKDGIKD